LGDGGVAWCLVVSPVKFQRVCLYVTDLKRKFQSSKVPRVYVRICERVFSEKVPSYSLQ